MRTLIVPCAGRNFINGKPRWSLECYDSEILLSLCLKKLNIDNFDRVIVSLLRADLSIFSIEQIKSKISDKIEIYVLDNQTVCPADTIYETLVAMNVSGSICIKDIDIVFECPNNASDNFISGIHLLNYNSNLKNARNKSFITRNEKDIVMDIIEKNIKSDIISIGLYGFTDSRDFIRAYNELKKNLDTNEKLFVSHIITYLIGVENKVFNFVEIPTYELFENESDYDKAIKSKGIYIINAKLVNLEQEIVRINKLIENGASIVFVVDNTNETKIKELVLRFGIKCSFLMSGSYTNYVKYVESEEELKEVFYNVI